MAMSPSPALLQPNSLLVLGLCCLVGVLAVRPSQAYPAFYVIRNTPPHFHHSSSVASLADSAAPRLSKRAFDRLDVSPFDFDAMTKRFSDDELTAMPYENVYLSDYEPTGLRKRAFDRLEDSGFFGQKRKRAFDRLDNSFMLVKKRSN